ncbi:MAG TPA: hypothetical protein VIG99_26425 [Myxococcaceae bacterium]
MKRAPRDTSAYHGDQQRPTAGGPSVQNTDPDDPTPGTRGASRLPTVELQNTDPDDPTPRTNGASRLPTVELQNTDPDDPTPRTRGASRLSTVELQNTDPDDPTPRTRGASRLPMVGSSTKKPRTKRVRRDRPAQKTAKQRAGSRRS